ncbi:hypothetical protein V5799_025288 [Amblyomma americanum]|uniref:Fe2OG dioxygenase domain-containing protein n=1 Tax=Amblyomma americanum TaxID=6943 RepID=A0AAQ4EA12_AMBAM
MRLFSFVFPFGCLLFQVDGITELHTSTFHLQEGLVTESLALEDLSRFSLAEEVRLRRRTSEFEAATLVPPRHSDALTKFLFASRLSGYHMKLTKASIRDRHREILRSILDAETFWKWWPLARDLSAASGGLCNLQQVYDVPVPEMAVMRSPLLPPLSADDLKDVARGCFVEGPFGNSTAWSATALQKISQDLDAPPSLRLTFEMGLSSLLTDAHRRTEQEAEGREMMSDDINELKSICLQSGDIWPQQSDLVCKLSVNGGHPYLLFQPLKVEFLSYDPRIVLIHEFFGRSECEIIRNMGSRSLVRGTIVSEDAPDGTESAARISKVSWLSDEDHPLLPELTARVAAATGLAVDSAEPFQVVNYGLGGYYALHLDAIEFDGAGTLGVERISGNRLATMLVFLSDVPSGGATAFAEPALAAKPRAGDALFWFDLRPYAGEGEPLHYPFFHQKRIQDDRTAHIGCPVLHGSKWIATKWIREKGNVFVDYDVPI